MDAVTIYLKYRCAINCAANVNKNLGVGRIRQIHMSL